MIDIGIGLPKCESMYIEWIISSSRDQASVVVYLFNDLTGRFGNYCMRSGYSGRDMKLPLTAM